MQNLAKILVRHQAKLWIPAAVVLAVLVLNMAAAPALAPGQWEYKTVVFQIQDGESTVAIQRRFDGILNHEAMNSWEYAGPCAHARGNNFGMDYVVLRRRVR